VSGTVTAIILGIFALTTVVLVQARELMREIARTIEEWRKLKQTLRRENAKSEPTPAEAQDRITP
jgi:hypothetical protein